MRSAPITIGLAVGPEALGIYDFVSASPAFWADGIRALGASVKFLDLGTNQGLDDLWSCHGLVMLSDGAYHEAGGALTLSLLFEWCRRGGALACVGGSPFLLAARTSGVESQIRAAIDISGLAVGFNASEVMVLATPLGSAIFLDEDIPELLVDLNAGAQLRLMLHAIPNAAEVALESSAGDAILAAYPIDQGWMVNWAAAVRPGFVSLIRHGTLELLGKHLPTQPPLQPDVVIDQSARHAQGDTDTVQVYVAARGPGELTMRDVDGDRILGRANSSQTIATFAVNRLIEPRSLSIQGTGVDCEYAAVVLPGPPVPAPIHRDKAEPDDFDEFWTHALAQLAEVSADLTFSPCPELSSDTVTVERIRFVAADFLTITGILSRPTRNSEDIPSVLSLPGYAVSGLESHPWALAEDCVVLSIDVRRVGSPAGGLPMESEGILTHRLDSRRRSGMRGAVLDSVRAFDLLRGLSETGRPPAVLGSSQGGALSMAVGALRPEATAIASSVPFLINIGEAFESVESEPYAELQRYLLRFPSRRSAALDTLAYVDAAHFLPRVHMPCLIVASLEDDIAPAASLPALASEQPNVELRLRVGGHLAGALRDVRDEIAQWMRRTWSQWEP